MRHVLGIDAGGTHTRCRLADESGRVLSVGCGGPANTNFVSPKSAQSAVERALARTLKSFDRKIEAAVVAGPHLPSATLAVVARRAGTENVLATDEFEIALAAALPKMEGRHAQRRGVIIMSGTGSFCRGRNAKGAERYTGGWGPLVGDEGSGYDLAKEALAAVVRAGEGRGDETMLTELILSHLKLGSVQELKKRLYAPPIKRHKFAELAKCVFAAAQAGDGVAAEILRTGGIRLARLASPVLLGLFDKSERFPVALSGGILREESVMTAAVTSEVKKARPRADVFAPALQPVTGAIIIGLESIGVRMDSGVIENLHRDSESGKRCSDSQENGRR